MHIGEESGEVGSGQIVLIPPQSVQYIGNTGTSDLVFLCIVTPPWEEDDRERVQQDCTKDCGKTSRFQIII